jgi:hypothetical protein
MDLLIPVDDVRNIVGSYLQYAEAKRFRRYMMCLVTTPKYLYINGDECVQLSSGNLTPLGEWVNHEYIRITFTRGDIFNNTLIFSMLLSTNIENVGIYCSKCEQFNSLRLVIDDGKITLLLYLVPSFGSGDKYFLCSCYSRDISYCKRKGNTVKKMRYDINSKECLEAFMNTSKRDSVK